MKLVALVIASLFAAGFAPRARQAGGTTGAPEAAPATRKSKTVTTRYDPWFQKYSKRYFGAGFDWHVFKAQAMAESDLIPTAKSHVGARGLMQLMPGTYKIISESGNHYKSIDDPQSNIAAGINHDYGLWITWKGKVKQEDRIEFMLSSYNAGEGPLLRARGVAKQSKLDPQVWPSMVEVAPRVPAVEIQGDVGVRGDDPEELRVSTTRRIPDDAANVNRPTDVRRKT